MDDVVVERELKLGPSDTFSLARLQPRLNGYLAAPAGFKRLHTVYYDSADLRLTPRASMVIPTLRLPERSPESRIWTSR